MNDILMKKNIININDIKYATYGLENNDIDVLNIIKKCSFNVDIEINNNTFNFDPVPNKLKKLMITYVNGNVIHLDEYDNFTIKKFDIKNKLSGNIFNITFSIPEEKIVKKIPVKDKILAPLIPGISSTYIYKTEETYYNMYKSSYFGLTKKKAGWDCLRHYEIICNGCIPVFENIENCPKNIFHEEQKKLFIKCNDIYEKMKNKNINDLSQDEIDNLNNMINELLNYCRNNLTTENMANYILNKIKLNPTKILFLSGTNDGAIGTDYLRCLILHGFKTKFGNNCHDYPLIPHIYKNIVNNSRFNNGFTYSKLLDINYHDFEKDYKIEHDISNNYYDIIVYGSYHRGMPFKDLVFNNYNPNNIVILCGEDSHHCDKMLFYKNIGCNVFVRELE